MWEGVVQEGGGREEIHIEEMERTGRGGERSERRRESSGRDGEGERVVWGRHEEGREGAMEGHRWS